MESFCIDGGVPLRGEVTPSGNKNAALPLLCATILTDEPVILHNVPMIRDVLAMRKLIERALPAGKADDTEFVDSTLSAFLSYYAEHIDQLLKK